MMLPEMVTSSLDLVYVHHRAYNELLKLLSLSDRQNIVNTCMQTFIARSILSITYHYMLFVFFSCFLQTITSKIYIELATMVEQHFASYSALNKVELSISWMKVERIPGERAHQPLRLNISRSGGL